MLSCIASCKALLAYPHLFHIVSRNQSRQKQSNIFWIAGVLVQWW